ncbi:MAG: 2-oxoacid:acceptor oxidoreductase family protein [Bdellovibrionia bacterium]
MWFFKKKTSEPVFHLKRDSIKIRMEAIGGQGAHSAGRLLAHTAVLEHQFSANHYSSFGSEKRGTPVHSFVRVSTSGQPIRSASYIDDPQIILLFHESLLLTHPQVVSTKFDQTDLIINSPRSPQELSFPIQSHFRFVATLDATKLARQAKCNINAVMLGALSEFCPEITAACLEKTLESFYAKASLEVRQNNLKGFELGKRQMKDRTFSMEQAQVAVDRKSLPLMGWENAPIGGVITNPGSSILKDNSASRKGMAPKFLRELCFDCGYCDAVCPDFCFVWDLTSEQPKLQGIDYQYCKSCEKCVQVCPASALELVNETEISESERKHKYGDKILI